MTPRPLYSWESNRVSAEQEIGKATGTV